MDELIPQNCTCTVLVCYTDMLSFSLLFGSRINKVLKSIYKQLELRGSCVRLSHFKHPDQLLWSIGSKLASSSVFANILKKEYKSDAVTLNTLIKGFCLKGSSIKHCTFYDKVVAQGFHLGQICYGTFANGLCKVGKTREALQLLRRFDGKLVQPNVVMYNTIIDAYAKINF